MAPAIVTTQLARSFGDTPAVAGIDLAVAEGEIYAFLGPNGAGKTTTIRMLTTLLRPSSGHASVAGHDVAREPAEVRRRIGVALQQVALDPLMTVRELMDLQAALYRLPRARGAARRDELLERLDLVASTDRRIMALSGGMRRRVDLALALISRPQVLFLDEPSTGLDPVSRRAVWAEVRRLNDDGTTIFLTTQYLEEADQLADRVGFIRGGAIALEGSPADLKRQMGMTRLRVRIDELAVAAASAELEPFGELQPSDPGSITVALREGAPAAPAALRALHAADVVVDDLDLQAPTLDDVFLALSEDRAHVPSAAGRA